MRGEKAPAWSDTGVNSGRNDSSPVSVAGAAEAVAGTDSARSGPLSS